MLPSENGHLIMLSPYESSLQIFKIQIQRSKIIRNKFPTYTEKNIFW